LGKSKFIYFVLAVMIVLSFSSYSIAAISDGRNVQKVYTDAIVDCTVCHPQGDFKSLNEYGKAYNEAGRSVEAVTAIDVMDSDKDGLTNAEEINAGTNPGDATSK